MAHCGRSDCPIVAPGDIDRRRLQTHNMAPGSERFRVGDVRFGSAVFTEPARGNGRFSPLPRRGHSYVADRWSAAILESALHEVHGRNPRIYAVTLAGLTIHRLRFVDPVRLVDLRDPALNELGLDRSQLTAAVPLHYPCTRAVADHIAGSKGTVGMVWTSRQGALHAERNRDGLAAEVLHHQNLDVAVIYAPDHTGTIEVVESEPLVVNGEPNRFVVELANMLRIAIM